MQGTARLFRTSFLKIERGTGQYLKKPLTTIGFYAREPSLFTQTRQAHTWGSPSDLSTLETARIQHKLAPHRTKKNYILRWVNVVTRPQHPLLAKTTTKKKKKKKLTSNLFATTAADSFAALSDSTIYSISIYRRIHPELHTYTHTEQLNFFFLIFS